MTDRDSAQAALTRRFMGALAFFALIMAACFGYLAPELENIRQMTAAANDSAASVTIQLNDISARKVRDAADRNLFYALEKDGFVGDQNRLNAARILEKLRVRHHISGLEYQIDPVETISILRQPENTGEKMSVSKISLGMRGFLDRDLRDFTAAVKRGLPGYLTITDIEMEKLETPSDELLMQIGAGKGTELLKGSVQFLWQAVQINPQEDGL
ncbi:MAG: hypothetical protein ABL951_01220 [Alphaproteobacteria bacterium]